MKITESREVYKCKLFRVTEDKAVDPKTGFEITRSVVRHNGSAVILAVHKRSILLVRQYRLPAEKPLWELPAGKVDGHETPLNAAKRELAEETGYTAANWSLLASFYVSPGFVDERMHLYLATDLTKGTATPMDDEQIEVTWFKRKEVALLIQNGKIEDAKTLIGFYRWKRGT